MPHKKTTTELAAERPAPEQLAKLPRTPIAVVADNIRSLDNVGLLFRLCELIRAEHLYLTGYTGYPRVPHDARPADIIRRHEQHITKTAVYAVAHQPWSHHPDAAPLVKKLKGKDYHILALEQTDESVPYHRLSTTNYQPPTALILGHEREGVRQELLELADHIIEIPILGLGNSHNVAMAAAIVLYHILAKTGKLE